MKRSEINAAIREAQDAFGRHAWYLPPNPRWDVTDFGLGDFGCYGLVLVNLAEQLEYCEKLMYVGQGQETPSHCHRGKKEDIICRYGELAIQLYSDTPREKLQVNGDWTEVEVGSPLVLKAGERVTLTQGVRHGFWAKTPYAIVGEVSTANDDSADNYFDNEAVGRFSQVEEDEPALVKLVSDPA